MLYLRFLSGPIFIYGTRTATAPSRKMNRRSVLVASRSGAPFHASVRAFETSEIVLMLGDGAAANVIARRVTWSRVLINRRGSVRYRVSRNSICLTHVRENEKTRRARISVRMYTSYYTLSCCMSAHARIYPYARSTRILLYTLDSIGVILAPIRILR